MPAKNEAKSSQNMLKRIELLDTIDCALVRGLQIHHWTKNAIPIRKASSLKFSIVSSEAQQTVKTRWALLLNWNEKFLMRIKFRELFNVIYFIVLAFLTFQVAKRIFQENFEIIRKHNEQITKWKLLIIANSEDWQIVQVLIFVIDDYWHYALATIHRFASSKTSVIRIWIRFFPVTQEF